MAKDYTHLRSVYDKTHGNCHICRRKLSFKNHGKIGHKGSWHIEHSIPRAKGGTSHFNNLFPACIDCNIDKGIRTSRTARKYNGHTRAPYSKKRKAEIREGRTAVGAAIGGAIGIALGGPLGGLVGTALGAAIGNSSSPKK